MVFSASAIHDTELIYELFESIRQDDLSYVYRGAFTPKITDNILTLAEKGFMQSSDPKKIKRRIYNIMVEGLQNITKHQANNEDVEQLSTSTFILKREHSRYSYTTCNLLENSKLEALSEQINYVNNLDRDSLKEYYKDRLINGTISTKGGAGLGLIDMALKSGTKLSFSFEKLDSEYSYFYLHIYISHRQEEGESNLSKKDWEKIKGLHKKINNNNILIIFNSYFGQESMLSLLTIIEKQIVGKKCFKKRMFYIILEMLQNVIKHAVDYNCKYEGKLGLFYISEKDGVYFLNTGNYILNGSIKNLKAHVSYINSLDFEQLEDYYDNQLLNFDINSDFEAGLGIIDMRIKSNNYIQLDFWNINTEYSFCIIRTQLME